MTKAPSPLSTAHSRSSSWGSSDSVGSPYPLPPSREGAGGEQPIKRKRNRKHNSCEPCRAKKVKCDRQVRCTNCRLHKKECYYLDAVPLPPSPPTPAQTQTEELAAAYAEITRLQLLVDQLTQSATTTTQAQLPLATPHPDYAFPPRSLGFDSPSSSTPSSGRSSFSSDLSIDPGASYMPSNFPLTLPPTPTSPSLFNSPSLGELGAEGRQAIDWTGLEVGLGTPIEGVRMLDSVDNGEAWEKTVVEQGNGAEWWEELRVGGSW